MAGTGRKVWVADEVLAATDLQNYIQDQVIFRYASASARNAAILSPTEGMVSYLDDTNALTMYDGAAWVDVLPNIGTAGTYTKVTTDSKGRVSSGTTLSATDLPTVGTAGTYTKVTTDAYGRVSSATTITESDIPSLSVSKVNGGTWTGTVAAGMNNISGRNFSGNDFVGVGGAQFDFGIKSTGVYNQTNSGRAVYVASDGVFGVGGSSKRFKNNIINADIDVSAVLGLQVREFTFKPEYSSDGSVQTGVIAEELIALGLERFVYFDEDGQPDGVAYEKLALALIPVVKVQAERLDSIEARISKLEK